jgi:hypothetical protein
MHGKQANTSLHQQNVPLAFCFFLESCVAARSVVAKGKIVVFSDPVKVEG